LRGRWQCRPGELLYGARQTWWDAPVPSARVMSVLWNYAMSTLFVCGRGDSLFTPGETGLRACGAWYSIGSRQPLRAPSIRCCYGPATARYAHTRMRGAGFLLEVNHDFRAGIGQFSILGLLCCGPSWRCSCLCPRTKPITGCGLVIPIGVIRSSAHIAWLIRAGTFLAGKHGFWACAWRHRAFGAGNLFRLRAPS